MSIVAKCDHCGITAPVQTSYDWQGSGDTRILGSVDLCLPRGWLTEHDTSEVTLLKPGQRHFCSEHCRVLWLKQKNYQPVEADSD